MCGSSMAGPGAVDTQLLHSWCLQPQAPARRGCGLLCQVADALGSCSRLSPWGWRCHLFPQLGEPTKVLGSVLQLFSCDGDSNHFQVLSIPGPGWEFLLLLLELSPMRTWSRCPSPSPGTSPAPTPPRPSPALLSLHGWHLTPVLPLDSLRHAFWLPSDAAAAHSHGSLREGRWAVPFLS